MSITYPNFTQIVCLTLSAGTDQQASFRCHVGNVGSRRNLPFSSLGLLVGTLQHSGKNCLSGADNVAAIPFPM
jgi:hypothetical protein